MTGNDRRIIHLFIFNLKLLPFLKKQVDKNLRTNHHTPAKCLIKVYFHLYLFTFMLRYKHVVHHSQIIIIKSPSFLHVTFGTRPKKVSFTKE